MKKRRIRNLWIILPVMLIVILAIVAKEQRNTWCTGIAVELTQAYNQGFLTEQDIIDHLHKHNDTLEGRNIRSIDVTMLEQQLMKIPYISMADVYFTLGGVLKVRVQQRNVIARLFDVYQTSVWMADDGTLMPVTYGLSQRTLVANGEIRDTLSRLTGKNILTMQGVPTLKEIHKTAAYIQKDSFLQALIPQIYINQRKELELIPSVDDHIILIGNADSLDYKLRKLMAFYHRGMTRTGWAPYDHINLKYSNQVICSNK
jgi:cell division protein FtsQ